MTQIDRANLASFHLLFLSAHEISRSTHTTNAVFLLRQEFSEQGQAGGAWQSSRQ